MADIKARPNKIARRYGGVLFELAHTNEALKDVRQDLDRLHACMKAEPQDWLRVASSSLPLHTQRKIIENLVASLKLGKIMGDFLMVLCQNRRLPDVNPILNEFVERTKRVEGIIDGVVETPLKLSDKEIQDLQKSLTTHLGKEILLQQEINENLIGGVVLRIGSLMIDRSIRTRLNKLKTAMKG